MKREQTILSPVQAFMVMAIFISVYVVNAYAGDCIIQAQKLTLKEEILKGDSKRLRKHFVDFGQKKLLSDLSSLECTLFADEMAQLQSVQNTPFSRVIVKYIPTVDECSKIHADEEVCKHIDDKYTMNKDFAVVERYQHNDEAAARVKQLFFCGLTVTQGNAFDDMESFENSSFSTSADNKTVHFVSSYLSIYQDLLDTGIMAEGKERSDYRMVGAGYTETSAIVCKELAKSWATDQHSNVQWELTGEFFHSTKKTRGVVSP